MRSRIVFFALISYSVGIYTLGLFGAEDLMADSVNLNVTITSSTPTPTPSSTPTPAPAGGGGGGIAQPITANVEFYGFSYPNSKVYLLKDGVEAGTVEADDDGDFAFVLGNLSGGSYNFGFWSQDKDDRKSVTFTFQLILNSGSTTKISGIVMPPTISVYKRVFSLGEPFIVNGASAPDSEITIRVSSKHEDFVTKSLVTGDYSSVILKPDLEKGLHTVKSKTKVLKTLNESIFSQLITLGVGVSLPHAECFNKPDINGDGRVNLIDFSIMAFWWKKPLPADSAMDLNCDGFLGLADFSMLAFHWTG